MSVVTARAWIVGGDISVTFDIRPSLEKMSRGDIELLLASGHHDEDMYGLLFRASNYDPYIADFVKLIHSLEALGLAKPVACAFCRGEMLAWLHRYDKKLHAEWIKRTAVDPVYIEIHGNDFKSREVCTDEWHHWIMRELYDFTSKLNMDQPLELLGVCSDELLAEIDKIRSHCKSPRLSFRCAWCRSAQNYITPWNFCVEAGQEKLAVMTLQMFMQKYSIEGVISLKYNGPNLNPFKARETDQFAVISASGAHFFGCADAETYKEWRHTLEPSPFRLIEQDSSHEMESILRVYLASSPPAAINEILKSGLS